MNSQLVEYKTKETIQDSNSVSRSTMTYLSVERGEISSAFEAARDTFIRNPHGSG